MAALQLLAVSQLGGPLVPSIHTLFSSPPLLFSQALVLMEFLVANGSERTIDDLRDHMFQLQVTPGWLQVTPGWLQVAPGWLPVTPGWLQVTPGRMHLR